MNMPTLPGHYPNVSLPPATSGELNRRTAESNSMARAWFFRGFALGFCVACVVALLVYGHATGML